MLLKILPLKIEIKQIDNKSLIQEKIAIGFVHDTIKNFYLLEYIKEE